MTIRVYISELQKKLHIITVEFWQNNLSPDKKISKFLNL